MTQFSRPPRTFLPEAFKVTTWKALEPFFLKLLETKIESVQELENFLSKRSELEAVLEEDFAWRYIKMNCDTAEEELKIFFVDFVENIQPQLAVFSDKLNNKIVQNKYFEKLPSSPYLTFKRSTKSAVEIFREANVPLFTELEKTAQRFGEINGAMTIELEGEELTMQAAGQQLESSDREKREKVFTKMVERRSRDIEALDGVLDALVLKRHQVALNAGFENFRDYQFSALGRFDYTSEDCKAWHEAVRKNVVPVMKEIQKRRAEKLGLEKLRPWDFAVDPSGKPPLQPFTDGAELLEKTKAAFAQLHPDFKTYLETMDSMGHFDLESRKGKAPGGFNYPLYEVGVPFIFMNSVGTQRDLETMVHEGGHAIHSFLSRNLAINEFKSTPSEVAELASMSMELISMETWGEFYVSEDELERAKQQKIEDSILTLPWVAIVDKFQHWLYENPEHSRTERREKWIEINDEFDTGMVDYTGFETTRANAWQKQMHIFEVPFYYIEYGFAQLGAISVWKKWNENKAEALAGYRNFMKLGYTKTIPEIYEAAGIKFEFSDDYVKKLAEFMQLQL